MTYFEYYNSQRPNLEATDVIVLTPEEQWALETGGIEVEETEMVDVWAATFHR